jgi:hypothetical protein
MRWLCAAVLLVAVVVLSEILSRPESHRPLVIRGGHALAPPVRPLPTLPP